MKAKIMDGKVLADKILEELKGKINKKLCLAVVLVGNDISSKIYINKKQEVCEKLNIISKKISLPDTISQEELINEIKKLNNDEGVNGILIQLPLPAHINKSIILNLVSPEKDVDGLSSQNIGRLLYKNEKCAPCTPKGIIRLLDEYDIDLEGKHAVVVGRGDIVGKPVSILLQQKNATVTLCHSYTKNLKEITKQADILVSAVGKPNLITKDMVKDGVVVIDVGITRIDKKIYGDVSEDVKEKASFITPVPGGIGPMTVAMLMENLVNNNL